MMMTSHLFFVSPFFRTFWSCLWWNGHLRFSHHLFFPTFFMFVTRLRPSANIQKVRKKVRKNQRLMTSTYKTHFTFFFRWPQKNGGGQPEFFEARSKFSDVTGFFRCHHNNNHNRDIHIPSILIDITAWQLILIAVLLQVEVVELVVMVSAQIPHRRTRNEPCLPGHASTDTMFRIADSIGFDCNK
jgi:hypothetical protein